MEQTNVTCLCSTTGDAIEAITSILLKMNVENVQFHSLLHNCFCFDQLTEKVTLSLVLPTRRPGMGKKYAQIFELTLPKHLAMSYLKFGHPLSGPDILQYINKSQSRITFNKLLDIIISLEGKQRRENASFREVLCWHLAKFTSSLRRLLRPYSSPQALIATFGQDDVSFTLVAGCYFFSDHICSLDTLSQLAGLFCQTRGQSTIDLTSFKDIGIMYSSCSHLSKVTEFSSYVTKKLAIDSSEMMILDDTINNLRRELALSHKDIVQFIYLSFHKCLNRSIFEDYTISTLPTGINSHNSPMLGTALSGDFTNTMRSYYSKEMYLTNHVQVKKLIIPGTSVSSYDLYSTKMIFWGGQSNNITVLLQQISEEGAFAILEQGLKGLLKLAAIPKTCTDNPKNIMFSQEAVGCCPVYRCEYDGKNFFIVANSDTIEDHWNRTIALPLPDVLKTLTDQQITSLLSYEESFKLNPTLADQLMISRHEYINPSLPIYNIILDFDLPVDRPGRSLEDLYILCLKIRENLIEVLQKICTDVCHDHPVYFFKSACETLPEDIFCCCAKKIGLRIITPLPTNHIIIGSEPLISLANILSRLLKLDTELLDTFPSLKTTECPFDTGIYHRGRCIRLPHTCKISSTGYPTRQLRLLVCHPASRDKASYVSAALKLSSLLYHSRPGSIQEDYNAILSITDDSENFLDVKTQKALPERCTQVCQYIETKLGCTILHWVEATLWPHLYDCLSKYLPCSKFSQLRAVTFCEASANMVQLKPQNSTGFLCLTHNHRTKTQTVRLFISLCIFTQDTVTGTLMSQCFATKCNNNKPVSHCSVHVQI
ncbi:DNA replication protein [Cricetid gammaherpesvirus 2]|uniref:DNA replication protein n=1 Tax=Cricetid gammaherpesvirus 2 TaxID=1605972 RepID=E9M5N9_9GAMA|nr:DNA replication protein [Cricetid gammaherpesvirus 2]ADW24397.1 DNA replication protein [Cricetid gammaherpesvirus 2]ADW24479.1 DNA replication protein [Cricetid gammaherpesvirus 2]